MDSMGYNGEVIQLEPNEVNWDQLLNPEWRGRVAVLNDPSIGMQDIGNAAVAAGMMEFEDLGNMTQDEIDGLIKILLDLKGKDQFRAFWTTFDESVTLMQSGEVVIESMWSPAVALLQSSGHPTRYAAAGRRLPRLGRRPRDHEPRLRGPVQVPGGARLHQLVALRRARRDHDAPGLLQRRAGDEP